MVINPAILGRGTEFFVQNDELYAIVNGQTHHWSAIPEWIKSQLQIVLDGDPQAQACLKHWGLHQDEALRQFAICRMGGFNQTVDMDESAITDNEFFDCGRRGACRYEGKLCHAIKVGENQVLGFREIQVIRHIVNGLLDKQIADVMNISINTVTTHVANIRTKTKQPTRTAIAVWALEKGIG